MLLHLIIGVSCCESSAVWRFCVAPHRGQRLLLQLSPASQAWCLLLLNEHFSLLSWSRPRIALENGSAGLVQCLPHPHPYPTPGILLDSVFSVFNLYFSPIFPGTLPHPNSKCSSGLLNSLVKFSSPFLLLKKNKQTINYGSEGYMFVSKWFRLHPASWFF